MHRCPIVSADNNSDNDDTPSLVLFEEADIDLEIDSKVPKSEYFASSSLLFGVPLVLNDSSKGKSTKRRRPFLLISNLENN
jgi:hypothetical protein